MNRWTERWDAGRTFRDAFKEQQTAIRAVYGIADRIFQELLSL